MVRYSNCGLKTGLKKAFLCSKMSGIWILRLVTWFYHMNTEHPYCSVFRLIWYSGVRYSDEYCIQEAFLGIVNKQAPWLNTHCKVKMQKAKKVELQTKRLKQKKLLLFSWTFLFILDLETSLKLFLHPSIHPSIHPAIFLSVCLFVSW